MAGCGAALAVEHAEQGQHRDCRHVLEQQDAEGGAAVADGELLLLPQHLQHERGGREGEAETRHQRRHQAEPKEVRRQRPRAGWSAPTCSVPMPNTVWRMTHRREGCSSRPMMNSSSTTPISANCRMVGTSVMSLRHQGPMTTPATR